MSSPPPPLEDFEDINIPDVSLLPKMIKIENSTSDENINNKDFDNKTEIKNLEKSNIKYDKKRALYKKIEFLNKKQKIAIEYVLRKNNLLICGAAGSGKSTLLRVLVDILEYKQYTFAFTAMTGVAATLLGNGATTLHSWMGLNLAKGSPDYLYKTIKNNLFVLKKWEEVQFIIIDEVSMLQPSLLYKIEQLARTIRGNFKPFGGITIILSGDFYQLEPIKKKDIYDKSDWEPDECKDKTFCFETDLFKTCFKHIIMLDEIYRQKNDPEYLELLMDIRKGQPLKEETIEKLKSCVGKTLNCPDGIKPTYLYSRNKDVDDCNTKYLSLLPGSSYNYEMKEFVDSSLSETQSIAIIKKLKTECNADTTITLKKNCMVILLINIDVLNGLVNGTQGVVIGFTNSTNEIQDNNDMNHKVKKQKTSNLMNDINEDEMFPIVQFVNGLKMIVLRHIWSEYSKKKYYNNNGKKQKKLLGAVNQIPLKIAFALTIHRVQGMTLKYIITDIGQSIFANGQAYTVLSRVSSFVGLSLLDFNPLSIHVDSKVSHFYEYYKNEMTNSLINIESLTYLNEIIDCLSNILSIKK